MNKAKQIRELLLIPISCDKKINGISRKDNRILSGQKYYSSADEDMSDFAIGFYEIIYRDILGNIPILDFRGALHNNEFAGDTMNSFNTIANVTHGAGKSRLQRTPIIEWHEYLREYHMRYHSLQIFGLFPWK